jgi:hypothetical protein
MVYTERVEDRELVIASLEEVRELVIAGRE